LTAHYEARPAHVRRDRPQAIISDPTLWQSPIRVANLVRRPYHLELSGFLHPPCARSCRKTIDKPMRATALRQMARFVDPFSGRSNGPQVELVYDSFHNHPSMCTH
jgi:hypothetical protein